MNTERSFGAGVQAAARRYGGIRMWVLDVPLAITVLGILNVVALNAFPPASFKAGATEGLLAATIHRHAIVEHLALTGEWLNSDAAGPDESRRPSEPLRTTAGIVNGVVVVRGRYRGYQESSTLTLRPVVANGGEQPTVQWLCGRREAPSGWQSPAVAQPTTLPDEFLFSICRKSRF